MKIDQIDVQVSRLPLPKGPWGDQIHHVTDIEIILVDVHTTDGLVGTGFSHTSGVGGRTIATMIDELVPTLLGRKISPRGLWHDSWRYLRDNGTGGVTTLALAALDIAYWDLLGKAHNMPVVDLLGRCRDRVALYGSGINLNMDIDEVVEQVRRWKLEGYAAGKVKVGKPDLDEDIERLTRIRQAVGNFPLMVDANQGWSMAEAVRAFERFRHLDLVWVEEPLPVDDITGHARLRERVAAPIALGENVYTLTQFNHYFQHGACDFVQADLGRVGGITAYLDIAALARAWGLPMAPHFVMELSAYVLCAVPNAYLAEDTDGGTLTELGVLTAGQGAHNGYLTPPDRPGHGLLFDRENLARHAIALSTAAVP
jgi:L-alanine-DL-glutamate epimerase-like enolase superfamily enzyme